MNAFIGATKQPTDSALAAALGAVKAVWDQFLIDVAAACGADRHEWKSYSPKTGWSLRVKRKQRTIVWLTPDAGSFTVLFILGEKAMRAAREANLPEAIVRALEAAPKYPEGTGLRIEVTSAENLMSLLALARIKTSN